MKALLIAVGCAMLSSAAPALSQRQVGPPGKIVRLNGIDLHYEVLGSGEPLLLLHGFGMCGPGDWGDVVSALAKTNRVILPDLRGHGWSTNPSNVFTMRQSAEDIRALLDHLGIAKIRAMGISAGGMTLLHLATKHPTRVETMVLIGASNHFPTQARQMLGGITVDNLTGEVSEQFKRCASRGDNQVRQLMTQFTGFKDSYEDMNLTAPYLSTIKARTLIVHGDRDEFFPVSIPIEIYGAIPGSQLWIVPNGDHVPIYGARTPEFLRVTTAFLKRESANMDAVAK